MDSPQEGKSLALHILFLNLCLLIRCQIKLAPRNPFMLAGFCFAIDPRVAWLATFLCCAAALCSGNLDSKLPSQRVREADQERPDPAQSHSIRSPSKGLPLLADHPQHDDERAVAMWVLQKDSQGLCKQLLSLWGRLGGRKPRLHPTRSSTIQEEAERIEYP